MTTNTAKQYLDFGPPKFELGNIVSTPGAIDAVPRIEMVTAINRHARGDWGNVCDHDRKENEFSLQYGFRLFSVYRTEPDYQTLIRQTEIDNIYVVPSSEHLQPFDLPRPLSLGERQFAVRDFLATVNCYFDVVLIDTPPNIGNLPAWSALMAADFVLTPIQPQKNPMEALIDGNVQIANAIAHGNPELVYLGCFVTNLQRRRTIQKVVSTRLRQLYQSQVFETMLISRPTFEEAAYYYQPVTHYAPKSEAAEMVRTLLVEVVRRIQDSPVRDDSLAEPRVACG